MKYFIAGYTPPKDVTGTADVMRYQKMLGVVADGIWGKRTQAAYETYKNNVSDNTVSGYGADVDWDSVSKQVSDYLAKILRPSVDTAINQRRRSNETARADIDSDAYSRGMGESSYSSTLKARSDAETDTDIANMESAYQSTLAGKIYDALADIAEKRQEQERFEKEQQLEREKMEREQAQFDAQMSSQRVASGGDNSNNKQTYGYADYVNLVSGFQDEDINNLFTSNELYWATLRRCIENDLGKTGYYQFMNRFIRADGTYGNSYNTPENQDGEPVSNSKRWNGGKYFGSSGEEQ